MRLGQVYLYILEFLGIEYLRYLITDISVLDHRIKLYLMITIQNNDEYTMILPSLSSSFFMKYLLSYHMQNHKLLYSQKIQFHILITNSKNKNQYYKNCMCSYKQSTIRLFRHFLSYFYMGQPKGFIVNSLCIFSTLYLFFFKEYTAETLTGFFIIFLNLEHLN